MGGHHPKTTFSFLQHLEHFYSQLEAKIWYVDPKFIRPKIFKEIKVFNENKISLKKKIPKKKFAGKKIALKKMLQKNSSLKRIPQTFFFAEINFFQKKNVVEKI